MNAAASASTTHRTLVCFHCPSKRNTLRPHEPHTSPFLNTKKLFSTVSPPAQHLSNPNKNSTATTTKTIITPPSKYPTERGSPVDSRQIVAQGDHLLALRLHHILFASEELARESLMQLRRANTSFDSLARMISACDITRDHGGDIGWLSMASEQQHETHFDHILPKHAREQIWTQSTKPGDVTMVSSSRGYHLVQIADVMVDVRKLAFRRSRSSKQLHHYNNNNNNSINQKLGILGGALLSSSNSNHQLTYKMETMGCQMNMADSERMEGQLQQLGLRPIPNNHPTHHKTKKTATEEKPDLVILNTCSIRDHAEQKVYSYIGPHAKRKRNGEDVTIVVAGCVAQQEGEALLRRAPEVDLVMGPQYANRISDLLEDVSNGNQVVATEASHIMEDSTKPRRQSTVAAWVNIIYGCNERCTYCIVPTTRGVEQSRPVESILQEVNDLVHLGYKEVTLLGQNIDAYGRDMIPKRRFSDLLRTVGSIPGLQRLRFVTSHPRYMTMSVIDAVAETPSACENFHVPFQSGSNDILMAMGRGHTREKYLSIIHRIRTRLPDASITADVIVGFPGETEEQFQQTLDLMNQVQFDTVNTAAYSPRPNTPAATWTQIPDDIKMDRLRRINALNLEHAAKRRQRLLGRVVEVLVEERNVKVPTMVMGRTRHGFIVYMEGEIDHLRGELVNVQIDDCKTFHLLGHILL